MAKIRVEKEDFSSPSGSDLEHVNGKRPCFLDYLLIFYIFEFIDEFDAEVFEDENASEFESVESADDTVTVAQPKSKKQKKTFNPDALANAFQSVLRQNLPSEKHQESVDDDEENYDSERETAESVAPVQILAKSKAIEALEEAQIDYRARKILKSQIRATQESFHFPQANAPETLNFERSLRKLATRGVVQLFNAIQTGQQQKDEDKRLKRQEKLAEAQRSLPLLGKESSDPLSVASSSASYFDFLKQQQPKTL